MMRKQCWLAGVAMGALHVLPGAALAQTAPAATGDAPAADIVVTGSRIAEPNMTSPSPILTQTPNQLQAVGGVTLEQAVNQLPQVAGSFTSGQQEDPRGGQSTIDLRALGPNRTLVLLDGRRLVPSEADGSADINTVPEGLIKRVDVVTGGASATYGSDAIAGVVNFVLDHRFQGLRLDAQYGIADRGDGATKRAEVTAGTSFAGGRGHIETSLSYAKRDTLPTSARDFSAISRLSSTLANGPFIPSALNLPSQAAIDRVFAKYGIAPGTVARTSRYGFNDNRTLFVPTGAINFSPTGVPAAEIVSGGSVVFNNGAYNPLVAPLEKYNAFGRAEYELTPNITAFAQGNYVRYTNQTLSSPASAVASLGSQLSAPVTNPFIPADLATILASRPDPTANFALARRAMDLGGQVGDNRNETVQGTVGIGGTSLFKDWSWDISYTYGQVAQRRRYGGGFSLDRLQALVRAADGGNSLCSGGFNPFNIVPLSAACISYITPTPSVTNRSKSTQNVVEANLRGSLFDLPAGAVRFAVGADYRRDTYRYRPDAAVGTSGYIGGIGDDGSSPLSGRQTIKEVYAELNVPILRDLPLVHSLVANGGYRYSDYNSIGGVSAYKGSLEWEPVRALVVRGGYQRAIRAPSLGELYSPNGSGQQFTLGLPTTAGLGDPCDVRGTYRTGANAASVRALCVAQGVPTQVVNSYTYGSTLAPETTGGNPNLGAERADTFSGGVVLKPSFSSPLLSHLSLSVDYFSINLKNAVGSIGPSAAVSKCYNLDGSNPGYSIDNVFCRLISRDANGDILNVAATNQNLGAVKTAGIDVEFSWSVPLEAIGIGSNSGTFGLDMFGTRTTRYQTVDLPGDPATDSLGTIGGQGALDTFHPTWRSTVTATYARAGSSLSFQWRYISALADASTIGNPGSTTPGVPAYSYFDLTGRLMVTNRLEFRAGINNLADKQPPVYASYQSFNTDPQDYDVIGRRFYIGARITF